MCQSEPQHMLAQFCQYFLYLAQNDVISMTENEAKQKDNMLWPSLYISDGES